MFHHILQHFVNVHAVFLPNLSKSRSSPTGEKRLDKGLKVLDRGLTGFDQRRLAQQHHAHAELIHHHVV